MKADGAEIKSRIRSALLEAGACAVGFATAGPVRAEVTGKFERWLGSGHHGALGYMERHGNLRRNPTGLLEGVKSVVSVAWPYLPARLRAESEPFVARYAYCADYHKVVRKLLKPLCRGWEREWGMAWRICVDSAPIAERYWAVESGVGYVGANGCLIVPGVGSWVFLSEILLSEALPADAPCKESCRGCGACVKACPTGALGIDGLVDCRLCVSALTVECPGGARGEGATLAGCDRCQEVCPHNRGARPSQVEAFVPLESVLSLKGEEIERMGDEEFRKRFAGTSFWRMGAEGLKANMAAWLASKGKL